MHLNDSPPERLCAQIERSTVALSLATAAGDTPLVLVNRGFLRLTGHDAAEVLGHNCRFLQTEATPPEQVAAMSAFLADDMQEDGRFPVVNRRRDGTLFTNLVFMSKLRDQRGRPRFILASQFDATSAQAAVALARNDAELAGTLFDLRRTAGQFGMTMTDSAALIARSITTLARLAVRDE